MKIHGDMYILGRYKNCEFVEFIRKSSDDSLVGFYDLESTNRGLKQIEQVEKTKGYEVKLHKCNDVRILI